MSEKIPSYKDYYQVTYEMFKHEHVRWNTWTLMFLGIYASLFYGWGTLSEYIPEPLLFLFGTIVSLLFLSATLNIRKSTAAWKKTLEDYERYPDGSNMFLTPFTRYTDWKNKFKMWKDFLSNFRLTAQNFKEEKQFLLCGSMSRVLTALAMLFTVVFLVLSIKSYLYPVPQSCSCKNSELHCKFLK